MALGLYGNSGGNLKEDIQILLSCVDPLWNAVGFGSPPVEETAQAVGDIAAQTTTCQGKGVPPGGRVA